MKYIVVSVSKRKIEKEGEANSLAEATAIMKADFMKFFLDYYSEADFDNNVERGSIWDFCDTECWISILPDCDWKVIEVNE